MNWKDTQQWLAETRLARKVTEAVFHARSRLHLARLDRRAPVRCQRRILLGLVHRAQATRFGREHDFRRVRTVDDFRRLVPLRTPAELWRDYWQPALPSLAGATWPGPFAALAASAAPGAGYLAVALSPALQAAHRAATQTALALVLHDHPHARLLGGSLLSLGDDVPAPGGKTAVRAAATRERFPWLLRPYALTRGGADGDLAAAAVRARAERGAAGTVTFLAGPLERLVALVERVKTLTGEDRLNRIWPQLAVVLYTRRSSAVAPSALRAHIGEGVRLLEMLGRPEGPLAVEDPRHDALRLLFDHGVYFEFVPAEEASQPGARRYGAEDVEPGVGYEVVLTSPAGVWACRTGLLVRFEQRDPLLLRVLGPAVGLVPVRADEAAPAVTVPALHRQSDGTPAVPPENFAHNLWSAPWDRG